MKRDFKKYLDHLDEAELREELETLYQRFAVLREYYRMELGDPKGLLDKYKRDMRKTFFPTRGKGKRGRSASRRIIKAFAEISVRPKDLVELHFYRAELMTEYIGARCIDSNPFHDSTVKAYEEACALAEREVLLDYYADGARRLAEFFEQQRRTQHFSLYPTTHRYWGG